MTDEPSPAWRVARRIRRYAPSNSLLLKLSITLGASGQPGHCRVAHTCLPASAEVREGVRALGQRHPLRCKAKSCARRVEESQSRAWRTSPDRLAQKTTPRSSGPHILARLCEPIQVGWCDPRSRADERPHPHAVRTTETSPHSSYSFESKQSCQTSPDAWRKQPSCLPHDHERRAPQRSTARYHHCRHQMEARAYLRLTLSLALRSMDRLPTTATEALLVGARRSIA
jgi:hypothetical protein